MSLQMNVFLKHHVACQVNRDKEAIAGGYSEKKGRTVITWRLRVLPPHGPSLDESMLAQHLPRVGRDAVGDTAQAVTTPVFKELSDPKGRRTNSGQ